MVAGLAGLAAGICIGMLTAPSKGSKTRKRLKKKILDFAEDFQDDLPERMNAIKAAWLGEEDPEQDKMNEE